MSEKRVTPEVFEKIIILPHGGVPEDICRELQIANFSYSELTGEERDKEILKQLNRIKYDDKVVGTPERTTVWEEGWGENLAELRKTHSLEALMPRYFRKGQPFRLFQNFIHTDNYKFDFEIRRLIQRSYFEYYLSEYENIYEFGCGTGINLIELSKQYPEKRLHGLDLTRSSVGILEILKSEFDINVMGRQWDFTNPDEGYHLEGNCAVYTIAALEQIGKQWEGFLNYLLREKPSMVLHLEPVAEMYDENNLVDWLALEFHRKRHYLDGYYTKLLELEERGLIEILDAHRTYVGNLNDESYSLIVWRPIEAN